MFKAEQEILPELKISTKFVIFKSYFLPLSRDVTFACEMEKNVKTGTKKKEKKRGGNRKKKTEGYKGQEGSDGSGSIMSNLVQWKRRQGD